MEFLNFQRKEKSVDRSYFKLPNGCVEQSARDQRANERLLNGGERDRCAFDKQ